MIKILKATSVLFLLFFISNNAISQVDTVRNGFLIQEMELDTNSISWSSKIDFTFFNWNEYENAIIIRQNGSINSTSIFVFNDSSLIYLTCNEISNKFTGLIIKQYDGRELNLQNLISKSFQVISLDYKTCKTDVHIQIIEKGFLKSSLLFSGIVGGVKEIPMFPYFESELFIIKYLDDILLLDK